jgi:hypothetical protein
MGDSALLSTIFQLYIGESFIQNPILVQLHILYNTLFHWLLFILKSTVDIS